MSSLRRDTITTMLMMAAALAAIGGFAVLFALWWRTDVTDHEEILRIASQEFVNGRPIVAGELAERVEFEAEVDLLDSGDADEQDEDSEDNAVLESAKQARAERQQWIRLRDFLVGVGKVARANEQEDVSESRRLLHEAVPYLEAARAAGFPPGRQAEGNRILGESLFSLGRYDEAIVVLQDAIARDPTLQRELLPFLAESQLSSVAPLQDQSLETIESYLSDPTLQLEQRWTGDLLRLRALIALKKWREANEAIRAELETERSLELSQQVREAEFRDHVWLLQQVVRIQQAIDRYGAQPANEYEDRSAAVAELSEAVGDLNDLQREASPKIAAQARLWSARAHLVQGMIEEAITRFVSVRQQRPFGAEAIIGGLEEIELLASQGRGLEMLHTTSYMMRELGDARGFDASLITFEEFRRRLGEAIEELRSNGEYKNAIDVARRLPPVFNVAEALTQEGTGYREWAAQTLSDGTDIGGQVARSASKLARARYRAAGDAFAEAARIQFNTEDYLATQWSAIDAYQKGRHFTQSIRLLKPYLRYEQRRRQPRGLVAYGRALLAEDDPENAIDALTTCIIEFPRDSLRYDARLLAALAYAENGDLENARRLLTDNLEDGELTPQSPEWQNSLLTLGELLYEHGYRNYLIAEQAGEPQQLKMLRENQDTFEEAIRKLDEAVARYWPAARAQSAAYLSARSHVMSSKLPRLESKSDEILDAARRTLRTRADQELQTALEGFEFLRGHLVNREEEQRLNDAEQAMLRNCLLAVADTLREMNQLEDAASAYRVVELRYMNEPPALEALLGRATCAKRMGRPDEANKIVRQARIVLQRIPNDWDLRFEETTRYDREGWQQLLTWMNTRIANNGA